MYTMAKKYCRKFQPPEQRARTLQTTDGFAIAIIPDTSHVRVKGERSITDFSKLALLKLSRHHVVQLSTLNNAMGLYRAAVVCYLAAHCKYSSLVQGFEFISTRPASAIVQSGCHTAGTLLTPVLVGLVAPGIQYAELSDPAQWVVGELKRSTHDSGAHLCQLSHRTQCARKSQTIFMWQTHRRFELISTSSFVVVQTSNACLLHQERTL